MTSDSKYNDQDVAAIITAMTDGEKPYLYSTVEAVLSDPGIGQVILCIEDKNTWLNTVLGSPMIDDPRLEVIRMPLLPLGAVRNQALKHVRLPWVAYCDGDDVWCKGKTSAQRTCADTTGCDFVGADHYLTNDKGTIRAFSIARYVPMPSSWMVRTEVMQKYPFDEAPFSLIQDESSEWWLRTAGIVSKARCPKMLLRYRVRSGSLSAKTSSLQRKARIVSLANIPGLGAFVLLLTWCIWLFTRQKEYIWCKGWGQPI